MDSKKNRIAISLTGTHGTAERVFFKSILPSQKEDKELFWVKTLSQTLRDSYNISEVVLNDDDSNGNHDVLIKLQDGNEIGIQVTEFTYELERSRTHIKESYISKIIREIEERGISNSEKAVFSFFFPFTAKRKPKSLKISKLIPIIEETIIEAKSNGKPYFEHKFEEGKVLYQSIGDSDFYVENANNIGMEVNFNNLPRGIDLYTDCIDSIIEKKEKSKSDWLLIWSVDFWKDRHWLEGEVIKYMKDKFSDTKFEKVFFLESKNIEQFFYTELKIDSIK